MPQTAAGRAGVARSLDDDLDDLRCQRCGLAVVDEAECCGPDCPYHRADATERVNREDVRPLIRLLLDPSSYRPPDS